MSDNITNVTVDLEAGLFAETTRNIVRAVVAFPDVNWIDAVSFGQLDSKLWLLNFMAKQPESFGDIWVIGGWVGMLPHLLLTFIPEKFDHITSLDLDVEACKAADKLLHHYAHNTKKFSAINADVLQVDHSGDRAMRVYWSGKSHMMGIKNDTIINTSWEHFEDPQAWFERIPEGKLVIIQANTNWDAEGHVNCPADLDDLCEKTPFRKRLFSESKPFGSNFRLMTAGIR